MKAKKILSVLLCLCLTAALLPTAARAADETVGDFVVTSADGSGYTYSTSDGALLFTASGSYTVSMKSGVTTTTTSKIQVNGGTEQAPVNITLSNVCINIICAFDVKNTSYVNLILAAGTSNTLTSGGYYPGIRCQDGAALTISGSGRLTANGGAGGAGIGGGDGGNGGTVTISGGTVTANGGTNGAGIGGGDFGDGGTVTISGGTVTANGDDGGAGIGGGNGGDAGGTVNISGGTVTANGGTNGAGIGGGNGGAGGTVTISGGTVTANGGAGGAGIGGGDCGDGGTVTISGGTVTAAGGYGGGYGGAGIGGGYGVSGYGYGNGGTVEITGGSVKAAPGGGTAEAIGHGDGDYGSSGTLTNGSGANVYLTTLTLADTNTAIQQTDISFGGMAAGYGRNGLTTDAGGALYFYLPAGNASATYNTTDFYAASVLSGRTNAFVLEKGYAYVVNYGLTDLSPFDSNFLVSDGGIFSETLVPATGFLLPDAIAVTVGGTADSPAASAADADTAGEYYYDASTGELKVAAVNGDVVITAAGVAKTYTIAASPASHDFGSLTAGYAAAPAAQIVTVTNNGNSGVTGYTVTGGGTDFNVTYNTAAIAASGTSTFTVQPVTSLSVGTHTTTLTVETAENTTATVSLSFTVSSSGGGSSVTRYTIAATAGDGGSISPSGSASVAYGNDKTYIVTADDGYEIDDVFVDGVSIGAVSSYTFENVKKAHTITASFKKIVTNPFSDVASGDWFYDHVMYVYEKGLMIGTSGGLFSPSGTMTRGMVVTVLYRLSGDAGSFENPFSDVPSGEWYAEAAAWASANGITGGIGDDCFGPDLSITREQLAVMLYNYAKYKGYDVSVGEDTNILSYNDALDISDYAYPALQWACGAGIMNGDNLGNLNPQGSAIRAEAAAMLQRFMENVQG